MIFGGDFQINHHTLQVGAKNLIFKVYIYYLFIRDRFTFFILCCLQSLTVTPLTFTICLLQKRRRLGSQSDRSSFDKVQRDLHQHRKFPCFSMGIFHHVMCLGRSHVSENFDIFFFHVSTTAAMLPVVCE